MLAEELALEVLDGLSDGTVVGLLSPEASMEEDADGEGGVVGSVTPPGVERVAVREDAGSAGEVLPPMETVLEGSVDKPVGVISLDDRITVGVADGSSGLAGSTEPAVPAGGGDGAGKAHRDPGPTGSTEPAGPASGRRGRWRRDQ